MGNRMNVFGKGQGLDGDATTTGATCLSSLAQARQDRRGILRQGDVTTACPRCGENGTIIEGERRMKFHGLPVAVDGALIHCACPAGSNRLIAPLGALSGAKQAAAPRSATNAVPASAASRATPLTPSSSAFAGAPPGTLEPGFYIVPRSMSWPQLLARLTDEQGPQLITRLQRLNPTYLDGFKAGEIVVIGDPDNFTACTRKEADLMAAAAQVRETLAQLTDEEANFMMRYQGEIAGMLGMASLSMGVGVDMLNKGLKQVEDTLRSLELLHQREFNRHGHLKSPDFFTARRQL
ncbi:PAAR domain-containing protein [Pseudomonas sp. X10]